MSITKLFMMFSVFVLVVVLSRLRENYTLKF